MLESLRETLYSLIFPAETRCLACGAPIQGGALCPQCASRWPLGNGGIRIACVETADWAYAGLPYTPVVRSMIHRYKFQCVRAAADVLAESMIRIMPEEVDALVPVPLHPRRERWRGFNQSQLLCERIAAATGVEVLPALSRIRHTREQAMLDVRMRELNVRDSMRVCVPVQGLRLLVVDDVVTTGSTAMECVNELLHAGAGWVGVLCAAHPIGQS